MAEVATEGVAGMEVEATAETAEADQAVTVVGLAETEATAAVATAADLAAMVDQAATRHPLPQAMEPATPLLTLAMPEG